MSRYVVIVTDAQSTLVIDTAAGTAQNAGPYLRALPPLLDMTAWAPISWYITTPDASLLTVSRGFMSALATMDGDGMQRAHDDQARQDVATLRCLDLWRAVGAAVPQTIPG